MRALIFTIDAGFIAGPIQTDRMLRPCNLIDAQPEIARLRLVLRFERNFNGASDEPEGFVG
jgi:hypothetical protein